MSIGGVILELRALILKSLGLVLAPGEGPPRPIRATPVEHTPSRVILELRAVILKSLFTRKIGAQ